MSKILNDNPISNIENDKFSRTSFSNRLSEIIKKYKSDSSITIGLYGKWGEGKSSVLNFVKAKLDEEKTIRTVHFNPWRYVSEQEIIIGYFQLLAKTIDVNLKSGKEKVGDLLTKYAEFASGLNPFLFGVKAEGIAKKLGKIMSSAKLDDLKNRLNDILLKLDYRIVVLVDDIDRLENTEIQKIFKLVKLTADFSNVMYVLAFDRDLVADALSENIGSRDREDGYQYLEKIIQVPIHLPKLSSVSLQEFFFTALSDVLNDLEIEPNKSELSNYTSYFNKAAMPMLKNPRLAIRYSNIVRFKLPLVYGEINTVDFLLLQIVKVFYPKTYLLLENEPELFVLDGNTPTSTFVNINTPRVSNVDLLNDNLNELRPTEKEGLLQLLYYLFPIFEKKHSGKNVHNVYFWKEWYKNRRIGSPMYYHRYFELGISKTELSDIRFSHFLDRIKVSTKSNETQDTFQSILDDELLDALVLKISRIEDLLEIDTGHKLAEFFCENSLSIPYKRKEFMPFYTSISVLAGFVVKMMRRDRNYQEKQEALIDLSLKVKSHHFLVEIIRHSLPSSRNDDISNETISTLTNRLVDLSLKNKNFLINEEYSDASIVYSLWMEFGDAGQLNDFIVESITEKPENSIKILRSMMSTITSSSDPEPYKGIIDKDFYRRLESHIDINIITNGLKDLYMDELQPVYEVKEFQRSCTEIENANQFYYLFIQKEEEE